MVQPAERERFSTGLFYAALLLLGYLLWQILQPFLVELGWATVLAICFQPFYLMLARRLGPGRAALVSVIVVLLLLVVPATFVVSAVVSEGRSLVESAEGALRSGGSREQAEVRARALWLWLAERLPVPLPPLEQVKVAVLSKIGNLAGGIAASAGGVARDLLVFVFDLLVTLLAFFFLLRDGPVINRALRRILPFDEDHKARLITQANELVAASVTASLLIGLVQGLMGGIAFALLGIRGPVLWGVVMGIASLIPVVGTALVWLPAALWLLATGETSAGVVLLLVGTLVIGNVDNVVRPWLLSGKATMSGLVIFISLMGGFSAFGMIGLVLGPLVVATVTALLESYTMPEAQDARAASDASAARGAPPRRRPET